MMRATLGLENGNNEEITREWISVETKNEWIKIQEYDKDVDPNNFLGVKWVRTRIYPTRILSNLDLVKL